MKEPIRQKDEPLIDMSKLGPVKGFRDFSGEEAWKRAEIKKTIIETFEKYGFEPAETPIIEYEEFVRGENKEDGVISDIFKLQDKGKRQLALRYEFTFQLKRLMKNKKLPYKRYQIGEVFRDEPTSSNRFREFTQCDVDCVGSTIKEEAEILALASDIFNKLGITPIILINNRALLNEILDDLNINNKNKEQVLREIDKIGKLSEKEIIINLKKLNAEKVLDVLRQDNNYFIRFPSYKQVLSLIEYCRFYGIKAIFSPTVVRGLSYYNGNVFEIKVKNIKETLAAGGSYMFKGVQCTGISFGLERVCVVSKIDIKREKYLVISLKQDEEAIKIAQKLRAKDKIVSIYYGKPSRALQYADSYGFDNVVFVGKKEVKLGKFKLRDMKTGREKMFSIDKGLSNLA